MGETLEARTALEMAKCVVCGEPYDREARVDSEEYRALREKVMFGVNAADCCDNACMMMQISKSARDEHIKY